MKEKYMAYVDGETYGFYSLAKAEKEAEQLAREGSFDSEDVWILKAVKKTKSTRTFTFVDVDD